MSRVMWVTSTHKGSAEGSALCQEREGVPRFLLMPAGRRPANRFMSYNIGEGGGDRTLGQTIKSRLLYH